jgi:tetratricopeptide (TPR) repeat protein
MAEGSREKQELTKEIQTNIFFVEDDIEALFKKAIEEEPDNPLNYAAYAYYLKPRKRVVDSGIVDTEPEAVEMVNKAIELWPDESAFYLLKIHILTEPHRAHTWVRTGAMEQLSISERIPAIEELFELAEKYDPQNHYIDYYHALTLAKFALPEETATIAPRILDELREGNRKHFGFFVFPPPLEPYNMQASRQQILSETVDPVYYDQWNLFGFYEYTTMMRLINIMLAHYSWPEDKDPISEVMYFLFNIGRTVPFNRTAFSLQFMLLDMIHKSLAPDSPESIKISQAIRYLQRLYRGAAQELYARDVITDSTKLNVQGLELVESKYLRYGPLRAAVHKRHANFLWKVQDILEIELPLPEDPSLW